MKITILKEYKLKGERNNRPRQPIIWGDKVYLIFVYKLHSGMVPFVTLFASRLPPGNYKGMRSTGNETKFRFSAAMVKR